MSGIDGRASARVTPDLPEAVFRMAPPAPEPLEFRRVDPTDAVAFNASIPIAYGPNPAAKAFDQRLQSAADRQRALECLANAIYYEAATHPPAAPPPDPQVVLNPVRTPAFPHLPCGSVNKRSDRQ